jgi:membrane associated rhomboid family serine protease
MIPLRDSTRSHTTPVVVYALIAVSVGVFVYSAQTLSSEAAVLGFYETYGVVPREIARGPAPQAWLSLITSMFLHGSWLHLGGNMLYLWVFGDNIEDALGHAGFLVFYLLTGVVAALAHVATDLSSPVPMVGASGAIAGVLGAYLMLFPRARILSLVFIVYFVRLVELPAMLVLSVWFILQVLQGLATLAAPGVTTVAWMAHVGGFLAGAVLVPFFARRR